jgi:hypothetical protein
MNSTRDLPQELCECGGPSLEPERSLPISGFSRELRLLPDAERFRFFFRLRGDAPFPVHLVFSPSACRAEVKAADLKAYRVENVSTACEAKRRWIAWWRERPAEPRLSVPRRAGRAPGAASGFSPS